MSQKYKVGSSDIIMKNQTRQKNKNKYKGIRRRKWGKWVSEIRIPGSAKRLWLGSYVTPEAAAVAHDVAIYCLREHKKPSRGNNRNNINFPHLLPSVVGSNATMSPTSVQNAAGEAAMAIDAQLISNTIAPWNDIVSQMNNRHHYDQESGEDCGKMEQSWRPINDDDVSSQGSCSTATSLCYGFELKDHQALDISIYDYLEVEDL